MLVEIYAKVINEIIERNFRVFTSASVYPILTSQMKIDTHRIEELGKFTKIVPPAGSCHSEAH